MTVTRIPGEFRYWVSSESRDIDHLVDLTWQEERWHKPRPMCSCEEMFCKHKNSCKHVAALLEWLSHEQNHTT